MAQAANGGQNIYETGFNTVKNSKMKNAREACPDGKLEILCQFIFVIKKAFTLNCTLVYLAQL